MAPNTGATTEPAPNRAQQESRFGANVLMEEQKVNGAPCLQWTVPPGSTTNAPTEGNVYMTTRGSCIFARANKAGREGNVKPPRQTCVANIFNPLLTKQL